MIGLRGQIDVHVSDLCVEVTDRPSRVHTLKGRMKISYHKRIQKKWIKRFGFYEKPTCYRTANSLICHPSIADAIREHIPSAAS